MRLHSICNALFKSPLNTVSVFWSVTPSQKTKQTNKPNNLEDTLLVWLSEFTSFRWNTPPSPPESFLPHHSRENRRGGGGGKRRRSQVILWIISLMPGENEWDRKREGWMCWGKREKCGKKEWCVHFLFALLGGSRHWIFKELTFRLWKVCENSTHPGECESDVKAQL